MRATAELWCAALVLKRSVRNLAYHRIPNWIRVGLLKLNGFWVQSVISLVSVTLGISLQYWPQGLPLPGGREKQVYSNEYSSLDSSSGVERSYQENWIRQSPVVRDCRFQGFWSDLSLPLHYLHSIVQYCTKLYSCLQYCTTWCNTAHCCTVQYKLRNRLSFRPAKKNMQNALFLK